MITVLYISFWNKMSLKIIKTIFKQFTKKKLKETNV